MPPESDGHLPPAARTPEMLSERLYRALLLVYPREHRREYGELMVQLFRDRMRYEGGGLRDLIVWTQMIPDLAVSAFDEHKKGENMKKRMWIAVISIVALLTTAAGVSVVMSQSEGGGEMKVSVWSSSSTYHGEGENALTDALRQAVEGGVMEQESADKIVMSFDETADKAALSPEELPSVKTLSLKSGEPGEVTTYTWQDSDTLSFDGEKGLADALKQAVDDGMIAQGLADDITMSFVKLPSETALPSSAWHNPPIYTVSVEGESGLADALKQAVAEGVITQETADRILAHSSTIISQ